MDALLLDLDVWADAQFQTCDLGDRRRNRRLILFAKQIASNPSASTPDQTRSWADCKGAYRLMSCDDVTFSAIIAPHCEQTRARSSESGRALIIHDTTEVSFAKSRGTIQGLGPTGNGRRQGFHLHSAIKLSADSQEVLGIAGQSLFYRQPAPKKKDGKRETPREVKQRPRESEVWRRLIEQTGRAPEGQEYVHLCDRGGDNFEVYAQAHILGTGWIVRAGQLRRKLRRVDPADPDNPIAGEVVKLNDLIQEQSLEDGYEVQVPASKNLPARTARVKLRWASFWMPRPTPCSEWAKQNTPPFLRLCMVEVFEPKPPKGAKALRWVLMTHQNVADAATARHVAEDYARRPLIEDFHKSYKTGCSIEARQYETAERLERIAAVLSVTAIRLLQIRAAARVDPERKATDVAPQEWIETLHESICAKTPRYAERWTLETWTIHEFLRRLAMLGGFLGRTGDGQPGWITLWRGVTKLLLMLEGRSLAMKRCG